MRWFDPRQALSAAPLYSMFAKSITSPSWPPYYVKNILQAEHGERVLDIGCGPADILEYLPMVDYVGFDMSDAYIAQAQVRHQGRGAFIHRALDRAIVDGMPPFDLALATGVLHHLDDSEAKLLFETAHAALKPGGRLVTMDGAFVEGQSPVARWLLKNDRGQFVRTPQAYESLARSVFPKVDCLVRQDALRIPYTHCILVSRSD